MLYLLHNYFDLVIHCKETFDLSELNEDFGAITRAIESQHAGTSALIAFHLLTECFNFMQAYHQNSIFLTFHTFFFFVCCEKSNFSGSKASIFNNYAYAFTKRPVLPAKYQHKYSQCSVELI